VDGFTSELDVLKDIANKYLPKSVEDLRKARGYLIQCDSESEAAFSGEYTQLYSGVKKAFAKTNSDVYDSLTRNWELLWDAIEAVEEIAKRYEELDDR
jgi:hypothetical protein